VHIRSTRNNLEIRDHNGLVVAVGETFGAPEAGYERLMAMSLQINKD
jgi:hypothetical protein